MREPWRDLDVTPVVLGLWDLGDEGLWVEDVDVDPRYL